MTVLDAMWWSLIGVLAAEAFIQLGRLPSAPDRGKEIIWTRQIVIADLFSLALRGIVGLAVAAVATASGQICSPSTAALTGLAGPLLLTKMFEAVGHLVPVDPVDPTAISHGHASQNERNPTDTMPETPVLKARRTKTTESERAADGSR